jgi:hypothetical protein
MTDVKIGDLLGLGSAGTFILTIVYLHGYSTTLGVNLFLYFGLNDYFRLAIEWLPPVIVGWIGGILLEKFFTRVERGATEEEIVARSRHPKFTRWSRRWSQDSIVIILVLGAILNIIQCFLGLAQADYMLYGFTGAFLWFRVIAWYAREPKFIQNWTAPWKLFVFVFPALVIVTFSYGLYSGKTGMHLYTRSADVQISLKDETTPTAGRILFLLDEYVVFHRQQGGISAFPRTEVTKIDHSTGN